MKNLNLYFKRQEGGFVITAILAIALIAVIVIFALKAYQYGMEKTRVNRTIDLVQKIQSVVKDAYANTHDFTGLNTQDVIKMLGNASVTVAVGSGGIATPWYNADSTKGTQSNVIQVKAATGQGTGTQATGFDVDLVNIPTDGCVAVGANFLKVRNVNVSVGSTPVKTPALLASNCSDSSTLKINFEAA